MCEGWGIPSVGNLDRLRRNRHHIIHQSNFFLHERLGIRDAGQHAVMAPHGFHPHPNFFLRGKDSAGVGLYVARENARDQKPRATRPPSNNPLVPAGLL